METGAERLGRMRNSKRIIMVLWIGLVFKFQVVGAQVAAKADVYRLAISAKLCAPVHWCVLVGRYLSLMKQVHVAR